MDMPSAHEGEDAQQPTTNIRVRREEAGDLSQFEEKKKKICCSGVNFDS